MHLCRLADVPDLPPKAVQPPVQQQRLLHRGADGGAGGGELHVLVFRQRLLQQVAAEAFVDVELQPGALAVPHGKVALAVARGLEKVGENDG